MLSVIPFAVTVHCPNIPPLPSVLGSGLSPLYTQQMEASDWPWASVSANQLSNGSCRILELPINATKPLSCRILCATCLQTHRGERGESLKCLLIPFPNSRLNYWSFICIQVPWKPEMPYLFSMPSVHSPFYLVCSTERWFLPCSCSKPCTSQFFPALGIKPGQASIHLLQFHLKEDPPVLSETSR